MARIKVNVSCSVLTEEHSNNRFRPGEPIPQVTIPQFRARLSIEEASRLATHLLEAIQKAEAIRDGQ